VLKKDIIEYFSYMLFKDNAEIYCGCGEILRTYGLIPVSITITKYHKSLLAKLSTYLTKPLYVEVYKHPEISKYVVLAYTSDENLCSYFQKVRKMFSYKVIGVSCDSSAEASYFVALKSKCEFYELLEKHGIIVLMPYVFRNGSRYFNALVERSKLESFISDLQSWYGKKNVYVKKMKSMDIAKKIYSDISKLEKGLRKLTEGEIRALKLALQMGYFDIPRKITLHHLGYELGLSKATVETHLRKALKKILGSIQEAALI